MLASFEYVFEVCNKLLQFVKDFLFIEECKLILTERKNITRKYACNSSNAKYVCFRLEQRFYLMPENKSLEYLGRLFKMLLKTSFVYVKGLDFIA